MDLSEKYHFSDFTLKNYERLLNLALQNYTFNLFSEKKFTKSILLRHDIEFSIPIALSMAEIEKELSIEATYFLQIHSEFYNPLENNYFDIINKIIKMGHKLGLHFDYHFWGIKTEDELEKNILIDKEMLEKYFDVEIQVFSFHNTNDFILSCEKDKYAGLVNVYSKYFKEKVGYCSDSTGFWRYERLEDRLLEAKDDILQILIHDGMWQDEVLPPRQRVFKVIDDQAAYLKKIYDDGLKSFGAKNIDWDDVL